MIINAFGMLSEGTFEGNLEEAAAWDIVDADIALAPEDAVTAEFLISAAMRATGLVTGSASMDEILACAVEKGVIASQDLSAVDLASAEEIVEKAKYAWTHPEFSNSVDEGGGVTLQDNVIDLSKIIPADAVQINGEEITIPTEYVEKFTEDSIVIFPGEKGGAYKIQKIGETDGATVIINAVPAQFEEVYQSIHVSY
ncbi:MAG: hypothetical protein K2J71_09890 [Oscillospiraceae bacterium]|nr:hypothetical protein [Oscillospiraceae bacterium]